MLVRDRIPQIFAFITVDYYFILTVKFLLIKYQKYIYFSVPAAKLLVLDDQGDHITNYILGPYNEGSAINITCVSIGGKYLK